MKKRYAITGASGLLGQVLTPYLAEQGCDIYALSYNHSVLRKSPRIHEHIFDLRDLTTLQEILSRMEFDTLIHTAGLTSVDQCETDPDLAFLLNRDIPAYLGKWCARNGISYIFISSDHVTSGQMPLFSEDDRLNPVNVYAQTKVQAEQEILSSCPKALILRTNFFGRGPSWRKSLTDWLWDKAIASEDIPAFTDSYFSPISAPLLVKTITDLSLTSESGIFHIGGSERLSKYDFALSFLEFMGFDTRLVKPSFTKDAHLSAPRPADMSMNVSKIEGILGQPMPTISESFQSIKNDYK